MRFVVDNQLPGALAKFLRDCGRDCVHVLNVGLDRASDLDIHQFAIREDRILISKDEDFLFLANRPVSLLRFIWVRLGNCRTQTLIAAFDQNWSTIEAALESGDRIVELR